MRKIIVLPIIPFSWLPASWGLRGNPRKIAEANYLYQGEDLENKIAQINLGHDLFLLEKEKIQIRFRFGHINEYQRDMELARATFAEGEELEMALIDVDEAHQKITKQKANLMRADVLKEPWVDIIDSGFNSEDRAGGLFFEFDWNDYFIEMLKEDGYDGVDDDHIVNLWFADLARETVQDSESNVTQMNIKKDFMRRV